MTLGCRGVAGYVTGRLGMTGAVRREDTDNAGEVEAERGRGGERSDNTESATNVSEEGEAARGECGGDGGEKCKRKEAKVAVHVEDEVLVQDVESPKFTEGLRQVQ
ncbi:hypothetical protein EDB89DRAFT_1904970 [Lactarius sanguifluus]|nr:hypothetical protein EDB89DRAFT_1904970 [Lactarius sanguifluus]